MTRRPLKPAGGIAGDSSGLTVRRNASAAVRDIEDGLVRAVARLGAAAGRIPIPDYACRRFQRAVVDAGSIPAASTFWLNHAVCGHLLVESNHGKARWFVPYASDMLGRRCGRGSMVRSDKFASSHF